MPELHDVMNNGNIFYMKTVQGIMKTVSLSNARQD
jgi:hypothetical protein